MLSVAGNYDYLELITNSKSGSFFFYSHDQKYIIKAMKVQGGRTRTFTPCLAMKREPLEFDSGYPSVCEASFCWGAVFFFWEGFVGIPSCAVVGRTPTYSDLFARQRTISTLSLLDASAFLGRTLAIYVPPPPRRVSQRSGAAAAGVSEGFASHRKTLSQGVHVM